MGDKTNQSRTDVPEYGPWLSSWPLAMEILVHLRAEDERSIQDVLPEYAVICPMVISVWEREYPIVLLFDPGCLTPAPAHPD